MTGVVTTTAPGTAELLEAAAQLTRRFGEDPEYTRAGGGNSSVKDGPTLYIKPSGVSLASITASSLMPLAMAPRLDLAAAPPGTGIEPEPGGDPVMRVAMAARLRDEGERRPSVECVFHALIPRRFVVHTHPTTVNALTCAADGKAIARDLFGDGALWVPYVNPGLPLAREIDRRRRATADAYRSAAAEVVLLQNHGLIVAGDEPAAIVERSEEVVGAIRARLDRASVGSGAGAHASGGPAGPVAADVAAEVAAHVRPDAAVVERLSRVLAERLGRPGVPASVVFDGSRPAARLAGTPEGRVLIDAGPLTPDQIVYAGSWPLWLDVPPAADETALDATVSLAIHAHRAARGQAPVIAVAAGVGVFASGPTPQRAETARQLYVDAIRVGLGAIALGGIRPLAAAERAFIETWEAETYRLSLTGG